MLLLHAEIIATVRDEHVELLAGAFVQKHLDAFAGRVLALLVLLVDCLLTAAQACGFAVFDELADLVLNIAHNV